MKKKYIFIIFFFISLTLFAQVDQFDVNNFKITGNTQRISNRSFQLTSDQMWEYGSIWSKESISLLDPFEMEMELFFGCRDLDGADGIVFVFHPYPQQRGRRGEGMGFGGMSPALGIEFDTYQNIHLGDPTFDHIALMKNGSVYHVTALTKAVPATKLKANIEDCKSHVVKINWHPKTKYLQIFFDGELRIKYKNDLVKNIFENSPSVYWGFAAATGKKTNRQMLSFKKITYTKLSTYDPKEIKQILAADDFILKGVNFHTGQTKLSRKSYEELDKLYLFLKSHPKVAINIVGHTDNSGSEKTNQILSEKRAKAVYQYLHNKGIPKKRLRAVGHGEKYPIFPNNTSTGRKKNRRIAIYLKIPQV